MADRAMPRVGDVVAGKYRIENVIGEGGMGAVFAATHALTGKRVALKWMLPELAADQGAVQRFMREAQAAGRIDHPNVVDIYDVGEHEGSSFLVMEFLHGETLTAAFNRGGLDARQVIQLLLPAMRGVAAAHKMGVVHRDLKPDNIFLCRGGDGSYREPKVLDFGISKVSSAGDQLNPRLTRTGAVMGTPYYMSPEQIRGSSEVDQRTDVYAFGVILYEALTGRVPFDADAYSALILEIATGTAKRPRELKSDLPQALENVVLKAMAREPGQRYPDVESLARALEPFAEGATFSVDRTDPTARQRALATSTTPFTSDSAPAALPVHRRSLGIVVAAAALLVGGGVWAVQRMSDTGASDNVVQPSRSAANAAAARNPTAPAEVARPPSPPPPAQPTQRSPDAGDPGDPLRARATENRKLEPKPAEPSLAAEPPVAAPRSTDESSARRRARRRAETESPAATPDRPAATPRPGPGGRTGTLRSDQF